MLFIVVSKLAPLNRRKCGSFLKDNENFYYLHVGLIFIEVVKIKRENCVALLSIEPVRMHNKKNYESLIERIAT